MTKYTIPTETLKKAWELRKGYFHSMRDIADMLSVDRDLLIKELRKWLAENQSND